MQIGPVVYLPVASPKSRLHQLIAWRACLDGIVEFTLRQYAHPIQPVRSRSLHLANRTADKNNELEFEFKFSERDQVQVLAARSFVIGFGSSHATRGLDRVRLGIPLRSAANPVLATPVTHPYNGILRQFGRFPGKTFSIIPVTLSCASPHYS